MNRDVFVTGIGLVCPVEPFCSVDRFWSSLTAGKGAVKKMPSPMFDLGRLWPMAGIDIPDLPLIEKFNYVSSEALSMALNNAHLSADMNVGLVFGTVLGNVIAKEYRMLNTAPYLSDSCTDNCMESLSFSVNNLAVKFGFKGRVDTISTACASGTDAIGIAARRILSGHADVLVAGGADVLSDFAVSGFNALGALTQDIVRPFDKNRKGLALGEGAAFVVLESGEHAKKRKAQVYGKILGHASISDANHLTGPHREGRGLAAAISKALAYSGVSPESIGYINAHGTGTVYNDLMETKAVKKVFGQHGYVVPISSIKSMIGHSFGAAGAIEAVCCLLAMQTSTIPATINLDDPDPECDLYYVPNVSIRRDVDCCISQSAGFGGQNSALVLAR